MALRDKVFVQISDVMFAEGTIVGYIEYQGDRTYRVLIGESEIIDAKESQFLDYNAFGNCKLSKQDLS